jgi:riboflavin biosynthesis pyrimidine reductase
VDSRGKLTRYAWLRQQPFWRDLRVLCSLATPAGHPGRLRRHHLEHRVLGNGHVDLTAALRVLAENYQVTAVRVDAGGELNKALLRTGLAGEISVIIAPYLAASAAPPAPLIAGTDSATALALDLTAVEQLRQGHIWLRYAVRTPA